MSSEIGVFQPFSRTLCSLEEMRIARAAAVKALLVDAPWKRVSGVTGVEGRVAKP